MYQLVQARPHNVLHSLVYSSMEMSTSVCIQMYIINHGVILNEVLFINVNGGQKLKKFLECCSSNGVVCPAFKHDFIHFKWAEVRFCH